MDVLLRRAAHGDIPALAGIEHAAGRLFLEVGMAEIANDDPIPDDVLHRAVDAGLLWVAVDVTRGAVPVAYLLAEALDASVHIEQVTVHPEAARRGIGSRLLDTCAAWAADHGYAALTLTTFRDVPWNAPYYRRLGFRDVPSSEIPAELRRIVDQEHAAGLARWPRVVMRRDIQRVR